MFNKRSTYEEKIRTTGIGNKEHEKNEQREDVFVRSSATGVINSSVNRILKGSKLIGDINIINDLELSGDVEGNITSMQDSNIVIKGICKGNIDTKEGSVDIEGELHGGNITAGKDVNISGKFNGGEIKALGKIFIDGEFNGKLEGNDIEIGANSRGEGEIFYKEYISISRGAKVDVQISQTKESLREVKSSAKKKVNDATPVKKSIEGS